MTASPAVPDALVPTLVLLALRLPETTLPSCTPDTDRDTKDSVASKSPDCEVVGWAGIGGVVRALFATVKGAPHKDVDEDGCAVARTPRKGRGRRARANFPMSDGGWIGLVVAELWFWGGGETNTSLEV